jgi:hypothetical protein
VAQPLGGVVQAAEERRLGQHLSLRGARRHGAGLDDAAEHRLARARIEQMVGRPAVGADPAAPRDAARRHGSAGEREGMQPPGADRPGDMHRAHEAGAAAHSQVPGAVDDVGVEAIQQQRELVGEHALGDAPQIKAQPGRAAHRARAWVDRDPAPALVGVWCGGGARRRQGQGGARVDARSLEVAGVARQLDLVAERGVDQPAGVARSLQRHLDDASHERAHRHGDSGVAVEAAQLAVGVKAGEAPMPGEQCTLGHRSRGGGVGGPVGVGDDHRALAAEAGERVAMLLAVRGSPAREGADAHD